MARHDWVATAHLSRASAGRWVFFVGRWARTMQSEELFRRYQELQRYVGWTAADAERISAAAPLVAPHFAAMIDDFYDEIQKHEDARKVITGGQAQIERLKGTLRAWLAELVAGKYDADYVVRRWRVGWRHVEIGLDQVFTNVALSRLRTGLIRTLQQVWQGDLQEIRLTMRALNKLLDLDLAIIEDAYQAEYTARQQRVERLATIGQVAGGVAHELRNPLNVVKTSVYYLLNARNATKEKIAEHLQRIERHVVVADSVITALSSFAKMPLPSLTPVAVEPLIRDVLEINPPPGNIQVHMDWPADLPQVLVDQDQLKVVFGNLVRNARDAMPQGGQLTVRARRVPDGVEIDVIDTGVGIAPENLKRVMEPLFSTKARGLGLGLAIARAILEKNKGTLSLTSTVGKGSTFTVHLLASQA